MKSFVVYDAATGAISRHGYCPDDHVVLQATANERVMEYSRTDETHVIDGRPIRVEPPPPPPPTPAEIAEREKATFRRDVAVNLPEILLAIENRINTLEGKPPITAEQFRSERKAKT